MNIQEEAWKQPFYDPETERRGLIYNKHYDVACLFPKNSFNEYF